MRKRIIIRLSVLIFAFSLLLYSCNSNEKRSHFYYPAEFEPNSSTCFFWSTNYYDIIPKLAGIISQKDRVTIFLSNADKNKNQIQTILKKYRSNLSNIRFVQLKGNYENIWIRDYGPLFLVNHMGKKKLVKFRYFGTDPGFIDDYASLMHLQIVNSSLNSTGGAREVNGKGTMILCEMHELDENNPRTREEIENEMINKLNLKKIIWLKKGLPQDDSYLSGPIYDQIYPKGVNGHIDEFCRFVGPRTILISSVSAEDAISNPIFKEAKKRLDENYEILKNSVDQDGKKFNVIKVPIAPLIIYVRKMGAENKKIAMVTSYMNFIITNHLIILPSYISEDSKNISLVEKENKVKEIFQKVFPKREIIKMRADTINFYSGGFHCISINEPQPPTH